VALKVVKLGMDTAGVLARFANERQALAMMDHPNIAQIFDAGATSEGRPYFVMEYIEGALITQFCDRKRMTTKELSPCSSRCAMRSTMRTGRV
jgi:serine/threonine protein kinase